MTTKYVRENMSKECRTEKENKSIEYWINNCMINKPCKSLKFTDVTSINF